MTAKIPLIYIAGPYAPRPHMPAETVFTTSAEAVAWGAEVAKLGAMPVVPHRPEYDAIGTPEFWYAATLALMERCDGVLLMPEWQSSKGARAEAIRACKLKLPAYDAHLFGVSDLPGFVEDLKR